MPIPTYLRIQAEMLQKLRIPAEGHRIGLGPASTVLTLDVQYQQQWGYVAIDCLNWGSGAHRIFLTRAAVPAGYAPGFFAFREGPLLQQAVEKLMQQQAIRPALLIVDGHGTAHPRSMGLASWLGISLGIPTMGVAKRSLLKEAGMPGELAGSTLPLLRAEQLVGHVVRTQTGIRPLYVSAGHLISQQQALQLALQLRGRYRIIEPLRRADQAARQYAKGLSLPQAAMLST